MLSVRNSVGWEHFSHGSDIGVRGLGASIAFGKARRRFAGSQLYSSPIATPRTAATPRNPFF
jgi:hypothetical protein